MKAGVFWFYFTVNDRDKWPYYLESSFGRIRCIWVEQILAALCSGVFAARLAIRMKALATAAQSHRAGRRAWQTKQHGVIYQLHIFKAQRSPLSLNCLWNFCIIFASVQLHQISEKNLKKETFILSSNDCSVHEQLLIAVGYERWMGSDTTQETHS